MRLPEGELLEIRPVEMDDVPGIVALYRRLSTDDLHYRFFSGFRPTQAVVRRWIDEMERSGGFGLVAVVSDGTQEIVGQASYSLLADGNGELGITVAPQWRGWLGPYLLDALVEAASSRGVENLEADILADNRPMLALVRARGFSEIDDGDWTVRKVLIGTARR